MPKLWTSPTKYAWTITFNSCLFNKYSALLDIHHLYLIILWWKKPFFYILSPYLVRMGSNSPQRNSKSNLGINISHIDKVKHKSSIYIVPFIQVVHLFKGALPPNNVVLIYMYSLTNQIGIPLKIILRKKANQVTETRSF